MSEKNVYFEEIAVRIRHRPLHIHAIVNKSEGGW